MHYTRIVLFLLFVSILLSACDEQVPMGCTVNDYHCIARQDAINAGISPDLFERQISVESGFNPSAISPAGAIGISQIMPSTAAGWQVDPHDPVASLQAAANAMALYDKDYRAYSTTHYAMALGCYNAGCGRVDWAIKNCSYWLFCMPFETQRYVNIILY